MRTIKGLLVIVSMFAGFSTMADGLIANNFHVIQCVDGKGLNVMVAFSTEKGTNEAQITHKVVAGGGIAHPNSIILLKSPTPVTPKIYGTNQVWTGKDINLTISTEALFPGRAKAHVSHVQAVLDDGRFLNKQISCFYIGR